MLFHLPIKQAFSQDSISTLSSLIGRGAVTFDFEQTFHTTADYYQRNKYFDALLVAKGWKGISILQDKAYQQFSVELPPFFYPYLGVEPEIVIKETDSRLRTALGKHSAIRVPKPIEKIEIYHFQSSLAEYDITTLVGHEQEPYFPDAPKQFDHLLRTYDYFVFMVLFLQDGDIIIIERPESSEFINFHTDNAAAVLHRIKSEWNDETNDLAYQLVSTIV